jgi:hypothetical protein
MNGMCSTHRKVERCILCCSFILTEAYLPSWVMGLMDSWKVILKTRFSFTMICFSQLSTQVERLTVIGKELRRKHRGSQAQVRNLIDERADFLAQLQDQHRELLGLRQRLGLAEKENEDLAKSHVCKRCITFLVFSVVIEL